MRIARTLGLFLGKRFHKIDRGLTQEQEPLAGHPDIGIDAVPSAHVCDRSELEHLAVALRIEIEPSTLQVSARKRLDKLYGHLAQDLQSRANEVGIGVDAVPCVDVTNRTELEPLPAAACRVGIAAVDACV